MGKCKVLFLYTNLQMVMLLPSSVAILSAYLKRGGVDTKLFDTTLYKMAEKSVDDIRVEHMQLRPFNLAQKGIEYKASNVFDDFMRTVAEYKPDIIAVSSTDDTFDLGMALVSKVRKADIHVIVGGVFPTASPDDAIANECVDSICIGEGEEALLELCLKIKSGGDITNIKNLWVKSNGKIYKNDLGPLIDINTLPYEDFSIFEDKRFFRPMQGKIYRMVPINIDRGCPYGCAFCAAPFYRKLYFESIDAAYFRTKTVSKVIDELKYSVKTYRADYIYFNSETFFARKEGDIEEFALAYARDIGLPFWCQTRIETITERRVEMLKKMNCDRISIGIEHGNEAFRRKILNKTFTNKQVLDGMKMLENGGISVTVNNIIGFPDETRELAFDTIMLNRSFKADSINAYFFVPYRGTPLREYCIKNEYIRSDTKTDSLMRSSVLNMPQFQPDRIKGLVRTFPLYVKMPESYFDRIRLAEELDEKGDNVLFELREIYFREYFK